MKSIEKVLEESTQQRLFTATKRPTASAIFFEAMMDSFIKIILGYNGQGSSKGVYGVCDAYYGTVEVQGRGSLHWIRLRQFLIRMSSQRSTNATKSLMKHIVELQSTIVNKHVQISWFWLNISMTSLKAMILAMTIAVQMRKMRPTATATQRVLEAKKPLFKNHSRTSRSPMFLSRHCGKESRLTTKFGTMALSMTNNSNSMLH
jgi:hypothetical protein